MKNLFSYDGKRVLITGCYSGMGEATAKIVAALGAEVVAVDIKRPSFDFQSFHEVDLRDPAAIEQLVGEVAGAGPIDRLFYCAGLPGTFPTVDVMGVNFIGMRHTAECCVPHLPRDGAIVSISSSAGMAYQMAAEQLNPLLDIDDPGKARSWVQERGDQIEGYTFSKMATILWTIRRAASLTRDTGIRLNCISPGPTDTPMMPAFIEVAGKDFMDAYPKPIGRNSTPEEQGWPLAFLNSDAASYISGENVFTDGGGAGGMMTGAITPPAPPDLSGG